MLLAVITGVEIVGIYLPFAKWIIVTSLVVLSVVKLHVCVFFTSCTCAGISPSARFCFSSA